MSTERPTEESEEDTATFATIVANIEKHIEFDKRGPGAAEFLDFILACIKIADVPSKNLEKAVFLSSYPQEWIEHYLDKDFAHHEKNQYELTLKPNLPFKWKEIDKKEEQIPTAIEGSTMERAEPVTSDRAERQKPKRVNISLTPSTREEFETAAAAHGMSLTEYLRRAGFAAKNDPSILNRDDVVRAEAAYKASLGPSRWTRDNE